MNKTNHFWKKVPLWLIILPILTACNLLEVDVEPTLVVPTAISEELAIVPTETPVPTETAVSTATLAPTSTTSPTYTPSPIVEETAVLDPYPIEPTATATATPVPTLPPESTAYQVAFVTSDDALNVRAGAGVDFDVVGELLPNQPQVAIVGDGMMVNGSTWVPIQAGAVEGWVNGRFLTPMLSADAFCEDGMVMELVEGLRTAVMQRDGTALSELVDTERGLRIRTNWWNPEVRLAHDELNDIFTSDTIYDFGIHDGSGEPFVGTFGTQIVPWLDKDMLPASEVGCNELLNGGSAGIVKLPDEYEPLNFITFYRPHGPDEIELDWGSWAIGIEKSGDRYMISYLIHYQWEI
ncbi:MAG: SH3 domain-containing protein [Chloroflexota bacterium]